MINVFFDKTGLTETSANYIANLAKETLKKDEAYIAAISCVHKQVSLINNPTLSDVNLGYDEDDFRRIPQTLERIMSVKSLIAWLREAIKEKEHMHQVVEDKENMTFIEEWYKAHRREEKEIPKPLTEQTYLDTLPIAERCKMFSLQTQAAVIGKVIHEKGALAKARDEMYRVKRAPSELVRSGVNNLMYYYEPSLDEAVVDEVFFALQKKHREIQAELNTYLHKQSEAIRQSEIEYAQQMQAKREAEDIDNDMRYNAWKEHSKKRHRDISALKIVIPDRLRPIYEEIQHTA